MSFIVEPSMMFAGGSAIGPPIDGFCWTTLGISALIGLCLYRPDFARYAMRYGPSPTEIRRRPLAFRTMLIPCLGAGLSASLVTGIAPHIRFDYMTVTACGGALVALVLWTAFVLEPLSHKLPAGDQPGRLGNILRRASRSPWIALWRGLMWGALLAGAVGTIATLVRSPWPVRIPDALTRVGGWVLFGTVFGPISSTAAWAHLLGEYARSGTLPPPLKTLRRTTNARVGHAGDSGRRPHDRRTDAE